MISESTERIPTFIFLIIRRAETLLLSLLTLSFILAQRAAHSQAPRGDRGGGADGKWTQETFNMWFLLRLLIIAANPVPSELPGFCS